MRLRARSVSSSAGSPGRFLARLLILLLTPVVLLANGVGPAAAVEYSAPADVTVVLKDRGFKGTSPEVACTFRLRQGTNVSTWVEGRVACSGLGTPIYSPEWKNTDFDVSFYSETSSGTACTAMVEGTTKDPEDWDDGGWELRTNAVPGGCRVTEMCWSFYAENDNDLMPDWGSHEADGCEVVTLESEDGQASSCPYGTPIRVWHQEIDGTSKNYPNQHDHAYRVTFADSGEGAPAVDVGGLNIIGASFDGVTRDAPFAQSNGSWWVGEPNTYEIPTGFVFVPVGRHQVPVGTDANPIVGVQVKWDMPGTGEVQTTGVSDPSVCSFWFGPKIVDRPADELDEPWAFLNEPPVEPVPWEDPAEPAPPAGDPSCSFSMSDPSTWLEGGMCAVVGLLAAIFDVLKSIVRGIASVFGVLGEVLEAIVGLVAELLEGLLELFLDLFRIDGAALRGHIGTIRTAWGETAPGQYLTAFGGVVDAARVTASGCEGPTVQVPKVIASGSVTFRPLSACSGPSATIAGISSAGITLFLYASTALIALRVLASSIGLNVNGVGRSSEGGGD